VTVPYFGFGVSCPRVLGRFLTTTNGSGVATFRYGDMVRLPGRVTSWILIACGCGTREQSAEIGEYGLSKTASMSCRKCRLVSCSTMRACRRRRAVRAADLDRCCPHRWAEGLWEDGNRPPAGEEFSPLRPTGTRGRSWDSTRTNCSTKRRRSFSMNGSARRRYRTRRGGMSMICAVVACTS
jgi:hypothetical protein